MSARVAITGIGLVSPLGHDLPSAWENLHRGTTEPATHAHRLGDEVWGAFPLFAVRSFEPRRIPLPPEAQAYAEAGALWEDTDLMYMAASLAGAVADAGLDLGPAARDVGLVITHENPGVDRLVAGLLESFHAARADADRASGSPSRRATADELYRAHHGAVYDLTTFMPLHRLARLFGLHGQALFVNNACASGLYALDAAAMLVRAGRCRAVLVAGADHPASYAKHQWFAAGGFAAADGIMRPFDRERHGFVLGDGAAALVVEDQDRARARRARPYALYRGGGFNQEAWKVALPDPAAGYYERALRAALAEAELQPADVDWIVPHGVATPVTDAHEARALVAVFGREFERPRLTALKPYVGHNLGGSGVTETALLLLAMRHGHLPPARGCTHPDPALGLRPLGHAAVERPRFGLKCAAGFGGFNAACVFERLD